MAKIFITRPGGKTRLLKHLLPRMPEDAGCYVEAFGGGAALTLARPRAAGRVEVYNDLDTELANTFLQVREHGEEVCRLLAGMINSRRDFEAMRRDRDRLTEVQRAARWICLNKLSFGGACDGFGVKRTSGGGAASRLDLARDTVLAAQARLAGVIVESLPWERLVRCYDGPSTWWFLDPPYLGGSQKSYESWSVDQWRAFGEQVRGLKGRWLVTSGDHEAVREIFAGCKITRIERNNSLVKQRRGRMYAELIIEP